MIYLFNADEQLIHIIPRTAVKSCWHNQSLTKEHYISDRLEVKVSAVKDDLINEIEYIALPSEYDDGKLHLFYAANIQTEGNITMLDGVQSGIEELRKTVINDRRLYDNNARDMARVVVENTNWQVGYMPDTPRRSTNFYYITSFEALTKMLEVHQIEAQFFVEVNNNRIGKRYIDFKNRIGKDVGERVTYGHNALKIVHEINNADVVTALIGRGKGELLEAAEGSGRNQDTYGRKIQFTDIEWSKAKGHPVNKPKGVNYVELPHATAQYGINTPNGRRPKFGVVEFDEEEDPTRLLELTYQALLKLSRPQVLFETEATYLDADIGDTIRVVRPDRDLDYSVRVVELKRNRLKRKASIQKLGDRVSSARERTMSAVASEVSRMAEHNNNAIAKLVKRVISADGKNNNWYTDYDPNTKHTVGIGDLWYQPDPEYEGEYILHIWNGRVWEEIVRTKNWSVVAHRIEEMEKQAEELSKEIEAAEAKAVESLAKVGTIESVVESAKNLAEEAKKLSSETEAGLKDVREYDYINSRITTKIIGEDGSYSYSTNRVDGETVRILFYEDGHTTIKHNGVGFIPGRQYTVSFYVVSKPRPTIEDGAVYESTAIAQILETEV